VGKNRAPFWPQADKVNNTVKVKAANGFSAAPARARSLARARILVTNNIRKL
jgi:hypothetical protein